MQALSEAFIHSLVQTIVTSDTLTGIGSQWVLAVGLTGSHARGMATPYSDVDIHVYLPVAGTPDYESYQLHRFQQQLVSVTITTVESKRAELQRPESAIRTVPGLRQMRVLYDMPQPDHSGTLAALRQEAVDFQWSPLQPAADLFASKQVIGYAEEAHKVLGGLTTNDESVMIYGAYSLVLGLSDIIAVQHGLMLESENTAFQQVMELMSMTSKWTICFRAAAGYTLSTARERARASLCLYAETARHLHAIIEPRHADVINAALNLIETDVIRFELTSTN